MKSFLFFFLLAAACNAGGLTGNWLVATPNGDGTIRRTYFNLKQQGDRITGAGLGLHPIAFNRSGLNPLEELLTLIRIAKIYRREAPDIVHQVALKPVIYGQLSNRW